MKAVVLIVLVVASYVKEGEATRFWPDVDSFRPPLVKLKSKGKTI